MALAPPGALPRFLQIRICAVRCVSPRVSEYRFVFSRRKLRANTYQQVLIGGHESGGILVVRAKPSRRRPRREVSERCSEGWAEESARPVRTFPHVRVGRDACALPRVTTPGSRLSA